MRRRLGLALAILFAAGGCRDAAGPLGERPLYSGAHIATGGAGTGTSSSSGNSSEEINIIEQARAVPPLQAYQVSFWAYKHGKASDVTVNYRDGQPFLNFHIPRNSLQEFASGSELDRGDSVAVTLTIDSLGFSVDFQPALEFSESLPATLAICYENANPDLNGDGVVDATDQTLKQQLAIWYYGENETRWLKLSSSKNNTTQLCVAAPLYHFSSYAVAW